MRALITNYYKQWYQKNIDEHEADEGKVKKKILQIIFNS